MHGKIGICSLAAIFFLFLSPALLFAAALVKGEPVLGRAILDAVTAYGENPDNEPYLPLIYNLIRDPALLLP